MRNALLFCGLMVALAGECRADPGSISVPTVGWFRSAGGQSVTAAEPHAAEPPGDPLAQVQRDLVRRAASGEFEASFLSPATGAMLRSGQPPRLMARPSARALDWNATPFGQASIDAVCPPSGDAGEGHTGDADRGANDTGDSYGG